MICFLDFPEDRLPLLPFTYLRPICDIRNGRFTIRERWETLLKNKSFTITETYLSTLFPKPKKQQNCLLVLRSNLLPDKNLASTIANLPDNVVLTANKKFIAGRVNINHIKAVLDGNFKGHTINNYRHTPQLLQNTQQIFLEAGIWLNYDFNLLPKKDNHLKTHNLVTVFGDKNKFFVSQNSKLYNATINVESGPVFIGKNVEIMEGSTLRGPLAICNNATVKLGTKIYGNTVVGPYCKVGGEISNTVFFGYANKGHDGFLGNSVIGEWCNLGAGTTNSNMKNNYGQVKLWNYASRQLENTNLQFCGLMMGDHTKCGINTAFNTGTVTGINANIFGEGFQSKFVHSFSWGGNCNRKEYNIEKAVNTAKNVFKRRNIVFSKTHEKLFIDVFKHCMQFENT